MWSDGKGKRRIAVGISGSNEISIIDGRLQSDAILERRETKWNQGKFVKTDIGREKINKER